MYKIADSGSLSFRTIIRYQLNFKTSRGVPGSVGWRALRFLMGNGDKREGRKGVRNAFTLLGRGRADMESTSSQTSSLCVCFKKPVILRSVKTLWAANMSFLMQLKRVTERGH